jgi:hypothetical protein
MKITLEPPFLIIKPGVSEEEFYRLPNEPSVLSCLREIMS